MPLSGLAMMQDAGTGVGIHLGTIVAMGGMIPGTTAVGVGTTLGMILGTMVMPAGMILGTSVQAGVGDGAGVILIIIVRAMWSSVVAVAVIVAISEQVRYVVMVRPMVMVAVVVSSQVTVAV